MQGVSRKPKCDQQFGAEHKGRFDGLAALRLKKQHLGEAALQRRHRERRRFCAAPSFKKSQTKKLDVRDRNVFLKKV